MRYNLLRKNRISDECWRHVLKKKRESSRFSRGVIHRWAAGRPRRTVEASRKDDRRARLDGLPVEVLGLGDVNTESAQRSELLRLRGFGLAEVHGLRAFDDVIEYSANTVGLA